MRVISKGNILKQNQHVGGEMGIFFMRVSWVLDSSGPKKEEIKENFQNEVGQKFGVEFNLYFNFPKPKMPIFVSELL